MLENVLNHLKKETEDEKLSRLFKEAYIKSQRYSFNSNSDSDLKRIVNIAANKVAAKKLVTGPKKN